MLKTNNVYMFKSLSDAGWFVWLTDRLTGCHSQQKYKKTVETENHFII